jgi:hypothetical protein
MDDRRRLPAKVSQFVPSICAAVVLLASTHGLADVDGGASDKRSGSGTRSVHGELKHRVQSGPVGPKEPVGDGSFYQDPMVIGPMAVLLLAATVIVVLKSARRQPRERRRNTPWERHGNALSDMDGSANPLRGLKQPLPCDGESLRRELTLLEERIEAIHRRVGDIARNQELQSGNIIRIFSRLDEIKGDRQVNTSTRGSPAPVAIGGSDRSAAATSIAEIRHPAHAGVESPRGEQTFDFDGPKATRKEGLGAQYGVSRSPTAQAAIANQPDISEYLTPAPATWPSKNQLQRELVPAAWREFFNSPGGRDRGDIKRLEEVVCRHLPNANVKAFEHETSRMLAVIIVQFPSGLPEAYGVPLDDSYTDVSNYFAGGRPKQKITELRSAAILDLRNQAVLERGEIS